MTKTKDTGQKHSHNNLYSDNLKSISRPAGLLPHVKVPLVPIISSR